MADKVTFIDISSHLGKVRSRIDQIGVELEGGWTKLPKGTAALVHDGSVKFDSLMDPAVGHPMVDGKLLRPGEMVSPPMPQSMLNAWLTQHFPQKVNETCGLHIHMSFKSPLIYQRLMDASFGKTILEFLSRWGEQEVKDGNLLKTHPLFRRLAGTSEFCQDAFFADDQASMARKDYQRNRPGHRYTVVNYPYRMHQTVEVRVLPMFDSVAQTERALVRVMDITNAWLVAGRKIPKLDSSWKIEDDRLSEERIECV